MTASCFAIVPDGHAQPTALFDDLEDAMEWGLKKYGGDRFSIRRFTYLEATETAPALAAVASN